MLSSRSCIGTCRWQRAFCICVGSDQQEFAMGLFTKDIETMDDLLLHGLKDIYYAENQIVKSLPKLVDKATNRDLSKGLKDHLEETLRQVAVGGQIGRAHV